MKTCFLIILMENTLSWFRYRPSMSKVVLIFFIVLVICQQFRATAQISFAYNYCVGNFGNYTNGSTYQRNLNRLFSNMSSQSLVRKFYNSTAGASPDRVHGLYQCREDLSPEVCRSCIQDATERIVEVCPFNGEAIVWYYECMLRYANRSIDSLPKTAPSGYQRTQLNVSNNYDQFAQVLEDTMNTVISEAAVGNTSWGHFATASNEFSSFDRVYCLAQCNLDLDESECDRCLRSALAALHVCCPASFFATIFMPSCHLRYDLTEFYNVTTHAPSPGYPPSAATKSGSGLKAPVIAAIVVGTAAGFLLLVAALWLCSRHRQKVPAEAPREILLEDPKQSDNFGDNESDNLGNVDFVQYEFATLKSATSDFSSDNKLGVGGFGAVYRGVLPNGQVIAIKRLSGTSGQGEKEFMTEARLVAKLQHRNLVKLLGFCSLSDEKLLVYEFMPNSSVDRFLFDPRKKASLNWETRRRIILGIARGLQYLHEDSRLTIVHRDLKPSNILLDDEMNPKIADFGMAKLFGGEQKLGNTSRIVGTYGYMAPEYLLNGEYSNKSDVYSFGVMILELISGKKNKLLYQSAQNDDIPIFAWRLWNSGRSFELLDATLNDSAPRSEVMKCIQIGLLCVQGDAANRPTVASLLLMLTGSVALPLPTVSPHHFSMPEFDSHRYQNEPHQSTSKSVSWSDEVEQDLYPR